jgi:hypothetical protein
MAIAFAVAAVTCLVRWKRTGNRGSYGRAFVFAYGMILYIYLSTDWYVLITARWMVRFLLLIIVVPEIVENVDAIRGKKP